MKKVIFTLSIFTALAFNSNAQYCGGSGSTVCTPHAPTGTPGLTPIPDSLPCLVRGTAQDQTIYFENFSSFQGNTVKSLRVDSIENLPAGLCWKTSAANNTFLGGATGCIRVTGTTWANPGQYKLRIIASVVVNIGGADVPLNYQNAETLAKLRFYVRLKCNATDACPAIDTMNYPVFKAYPTTNCNVGIADVQANISDLSVTPNPFSSVANVSFTAEKSDVYTEKLTSVLGNVVFMNKLEVKEGNNTSKIYSNGLSSGVYFYTLSSKNGNITRRVVID